MKLNSCCWCPCGVKMMPWRERYNLDYLFENDCHSKNRWRSMTPLSLMQHLESKPDKYHAAVKNYLQNLYPDWEDKSRAQSRMGKGKWTHAKG